MCLLVTTAGVLSLPPKSRVNEVEQHCQVQLTMAEAQAAQLRKDKAEEEAAAARRLDGECGVHRGGEVEMRWVVAVVVAVRGSSGLFFFIVIIITVLFYSVFCLRAFSCAVE